jgi:hypothetical protein
MNPRIGTFFVAMAVIAVLAPAAGATVLWDQSAFNESGAGFFNSISGSPPMGLTVYTVDDVTVGPAGWTVTSITTYYSAIDPNWGLGITEGRLHVFPKTGPLPVNGTDDPTLSQTVAMSAALINGHFEITASGLNLILTPGEYWIGITPVAPSGFFGPEIHMSTMTPAGDAGASYDEFGSFGPPLVWFNFNAGVDTAVLIEGEAPVPVNRASWGGIKARFGK